jgi:hypothetical protein
VFDIQFAPIVIFIQVADSDDSSQGGGKPQHLDWAGGHFPPLAAIQTFGIQQKRTVNISHPRATPNDNDNALSVR